MNKNLYNKTVPANSHSFKKLNVTRHRDMIHNGSKAVLGVYVYAVEYRFDFPQTEFIYSVCVMCFTSKWNNQ